MNDSELLDIFNVEVREYLEALNNALLHIEMIEDNDPTFAGQVREMNRIAHSMKGAARTVGLSEIEAIAHHMEEIFGAVQRKAFSLTPAGADVLYDSLDMITLLVEGDRPAGALEQADLDDEAAGLGTVDDLLLRLGALLRGEDPHETTSDSRQMAVVHVVDPVEAHAATVPAPPHEAEKPPAALDRSLISQTGLSPRAYAATATGQFPAVGVGDGGTVVVRSAEDTLRVAVSKLDQLMAEATELLVARMHTEELGRSAAVVRRLHNRWQREWRAVRTAYIRLQRRLQNEDKAINSEMVTLLRFMEANQRYLLEMNRHLSTLTQSIAVHHMHLGTLADQFQDEIGSMRLLPFESIIGSFQRMVRDLSRDLGKQIHLEVGGAGVEIDKTVLEALKDPLMHLIRNAVDHGIEPPDRRVLAGKSPVGRVDIHLEQRGSEIVICVQDDGGGIDPDRVRRSIVKSGLLNEAEAASLSDEEARMYIFQSGLTTSDKVTAVSGRGLGMDIVRDRVESLRGRVTLSSALGEGTLVTIRVPVSLTRIRCVLLTVGDQQFALPSAMIVRMVTAPRSSVFSAEGREMLMVNDRPLPFAALGAVLDLPALPLSADVFHAVVVQATERTVVFEVDHLLSEQELVLKPLGVELSRARFVVGAALLGSGEVVIVLDANDLVRQAMGTMLPKRRTGLIALQAPAKRRVRVMVVDDSITTRTLEKNILETAGFEVQIAVDGLEAWKVLQHEEFDVVISDIEMPRMNGLELAARIKSNLDLQRIPVVLLTSLNKPEQREAGLRAGADAYLVKSRFDQSELLQTIYSLI